MPLAASSAVDDGPAPSSMAPGMAQSRASRPASGDLSGTRIRLPQRHLPVLPARLSGTPYASPHRSHWTWIGIALTNHLSLRGGQTWLTHGVPAATLVAAGERVLLPQIATRHPARLNLMLWAQVRSVPTPCQPQVSVCSRPVRPSGGRSHVGGRGGSNRL